MGVALPGGGGALPALRRHPRERGGACSASLPLATMKPRPQEGVGSFWPHPYGGKRGRGFPSTATWPPPSGWTGSDVKATERRGFLCDVARVGGAGPGRCCWLDGFVQLAPPLPVNQMRWAGFGMRGLAPPGGLGADGGGPKIFFCPLKPKIFPFQPPFLGPNSWFWGLKVHF